MAMCNTKLHSGTIDPSIKQKRHSNAHGNVWTKLSISSSNQSIR